MIFLIVILKELELFNRELSRVTEILFKIEFFMQLVHYADVILIYGGKDMFIWLTSVPVVEKIDGCFMEKV
jgi:hypothetical protein